MRLFFFFFRLIPHTVPLLHEPSRNKKNRERRKFRKVYIIILYEKVMFWHSVAEETVGLFGQYYILVVV